ncbi:MAG: hypothetical protein REI11_02825 [Patulibacter sp.]|nr:hypothetical protein [Patulibacter sp.]
MNRIRTITAGAAGVVVLAGAAVASGAVGSASPPPAKPLAQALHDAVAAPPVQGISARITFTNKVIDSSSLTGGGPLLTGASGRVWITDDGRARLELQSDRGDAQVTTDGKTVTVYDASSNTAYEADLPRDLQDAHASHDATTPGATTPAGTTPQAPSIQKIQDILTKVGKAVDLSTADPTTVAGVGAYSVKLAPHHGGLIGKAEIAWDAATGVPLRFGIYAAGATKPVLELAATDISYGPVADSTFTVSVPKGAKVEHLDLGSGSTDDDAAGTSSSQNALVAPDDPKTRAAVKAQAEKVAALTPVQVADALPFTLSAPATLAGQPRSHVRLLTRPVVGKIDPKGALVTYGEGLGGIAVLQTPVDAAKAGAPAATTPADSGDSGFGHHRSGSGDGKVELSTPTVDINGAKAFELSTALGTVIRFQRGGVQYTVVGSVTSAVAEAAARGL